VTNSSRSRSVASVYGADKIWDQLNKDGIQVARCTVERLMRVMDIQGCRRGRVWVKTTQGDESLGRPADLVERDFRAPAPNVAIGGRHVSRVELIGYDSWLRRTGRFMGVGVETSPPSA
jgi:transposase InsO family protein